MKTKDRVIGHKTLLIKDLSPKKSPAFSPNLFDYLRSRGVFFSNGGLYDSVYRVKKGTKAEQWFREGELLVGYIDDNFFCGSRMNAVLSQGKDASRAAYPCGVSGLELIEGFWDQYLKLGRCAIDSGHQEVYQGDRFKVEEHSRTCLWCGHQQNKVETPRVVIDTSWVSQ